MSLNEVETEWDSRAFVGRKRELSVFEALRAKLPASRQLLNVYGTGGMGKSFLLDEFEKRARASGGTTATVDSVGFVRTPHAFCSRLLEALDIRAERGAEETRLVDACVDALAGIAEASPLYLFIDTYEQMESLDQWLRESFLKRLGKNVMIVVAGRYPLSEAWRISAAWGRCLTRLPLAELDAASVERYAEYMHIFDRGAATRFRSASRGHPLTMSLLAFLYASPGSPELDANAEAGPYAEADRYDTLAYVVNRWLEEVPDEHLRPFVEAAAVLRRFQQESLSYAMEREITASEFYQLIRFSFIRKVDRGWAMHGLMRELVNRELLSRTPERYERIRQRAMQYYYAKMTEPNESGGEAQDGVEIMYYVGDSLIRAFMNWFDTAPLRFFPAGPAERSELEAYVQRRKTESREARIEIYDPLSDRRFAFGLTARETAYTVQKVDFEALFALGYDIVRVLRNAAGAMLGFAVVVPINEKTLPYLRRAPRSKAYFSNLSSAMEARLAVPSDYRAGWFVETIDTADYEDPAQQSAMGYLLHDLIYSGELIVESPAPTTYFIEAHKSLGFEVARCPAHTEYEDTTPAQTFVIDRRGELGLDYVHRMLRLTGQSRLVGQAASEAAAGAQAEADAPPAADRIAGRPELTPREKEVAKLLEQGMKNADIAAALFVSEVTVKKHLRSMMAKLAAKNRTQLLKRLLE
ncbi:LuxR family transcriptional regulator [Paenibacillus antri]|nr:LuxR family transcriptional regulator [Paenibacillus antri]